MKKALLSLGVFIILTIILTYPSVLHLGTMVRNCGDPLFVAWTIIWNIQTLFSNPSQLFHANIFYPHKYTLAYSEHMLANSLLALPIYFFSENPLLSYNVIKLLTFILCGFGVWLLVFYLTKDWLAGIVSGIIYSFCSFRFSQLTHLHVLSSQWIAFALVFLHKFWRNPRMTRYLFLFCLFFILQFLTSGHNGIYLGVITVAFFAYYGIAERQSPGTWLKLIFALTVTGLVILPFYYPYFIVAKEYGFVRKLAEAGDYAPQLQSFLAVSSNNLIYGKFLGRFCRPEAVLFPGLIVLLLAFWKSKKQTEEIKLCLCKSMKIINNVLNVFVLINILVVILVALTGGIDTGLSVCGIKLKASSLDHPLYLLLVLCFCKSLFYWQRLRSFFVATRGSLQFYGLLIIIGFVCTLGPTIKLFDRELIKGPYIILYHIIPGIQGLRTPGRWYVVFILGLAVLAGFGFQRLRSRFHKKAYIWLSVIPLLVVLEYINIPLPLYCYVNKEPANVYQWLAEQPEDTVIIELPMPKNTTAFFSEARYMYWSLWHRKKMVNGYSGYCPSAYYVITKEMKKFPSKDTIQMLKLVGVNLIVVHDPAIAEKIESYPDEFVLRFKEEDDFVYEIISEAMPDKVAAQKTLVPNEGWTVTANYNSDSCLKMLDNDLETRWHSNQPQSSGMLIKIDLGKKYLISGIGLFYADAKYDYPRTIVVEKSLDGESWEAVPAEFIYAQYVKHLVEYPCDNQMQLTFEPQEARYIRLMQTGQSDKFYWSIYEIEIYQGDQ